MKKYLKLSASIATALLFGVVAIVSIPAARGQEDTIEIDGAMLERCEEEGLTGETCACWFDAIMEAEDWDSISEEEVDELAPYYQEELAACIEGNQ